MTPFVSKAPWYIAAIGALAILLAPVAWGGDDEKDGKEFSITVKTKPQTRFCAARVKTTYKRWDDEVEVNATLDNESCAASSGRFTIAVRTRNGEGELEEAEYVEEWEREDASAVTFSKRYPVEREHELTRVRTKAVRCRCAEAWEGEAAPD